MSEMPLLKLQARSLSRYLDRSLLHEILIVDNSVDGELDVKQLMPQYGGLPVRIIKTPQVVSIPKKVHGWFTQQIVKLMVAKHVTTERYLILDTKNHLTRSFGAGELEAPDGRLRTGWYAYGNHTLKRYLLHCCDYLKVDPELVMNRFIPTTPPFTMITSLTRQLIGSIETREKRPFAETFVKNELTEFFLYGTYVASIGKKLEDYYKFDNWMGTNLWKEYDNKRMQEIIHHPGIFFAVHRRCFKNMDDNTIDDLAKLWHNCHLFASYHDAKRFIKGCAKTYATA
jgi:hypothetical protein